LSRIPRDIDSLRILHYPDPALREVAEPIGDPTDPQVARLAEKMRQLMHEANGVGLAATQLGVGVRIFIANPVRGPGQDMVIVNPEVIQTEGWQETREGCLSVPDVTLTLRRRDRVTLRYQDLAGMTHQVEATGLLASIFQHEGDHLDGRLIVDRAGVIGRMAIRDTLRRLEGEFKAAQAAT